MITRNPMQLKAFIKKKAAEKNISAQLVMTSSIPALQQMDVILPYITPYIKPSSITI